MSCQRCQADPSPFGEGSDSRKCAFDVAGAFTPRNWNCATIEALTANSADIYGNDETMQLRGLGNCSGWLVFTRYKRRGCVSSVAHVGDFYPPRLLTLAMAEDVLEGKYDDDL